MNKNCRTLGAMMIASALVIGATAFSARAQAPAPTYIPSIADLMNGAVQPRHAKLAMAVRARNWTYAAYEIRELRSAFARIARTFPQYEGQDTASLMTMAKTPVDNLENAIKGKDARAASTAYATLTETCNNCHTTIKRSYIVIVTPSASMFPNQDFSAKPTP